VGSFGVFGWCFILIFITLGYFYLMFLSDRCVRLWLFIRYSINFIMINIAEVGGWYVYYILFITYVCA